MQAGAFSLDLFADAMTQLVDDVQGGIRYWPGFIDAALAQAWFVALQENAAWTHIQRPMYDRVVDVPRLLVSCRRDTFPRLGTRIARGPHRKVVVGFLAPSVSEVMGVFLFEVVHGIRVLKR